MRICTDLNEWSRSKPFIPTNLGRKIKILSSKKESALRIRASALWGERRLKEKTEPHDGRELNTNKIPPLWEIPIIPPSSFANYTEVTRVQGEESLKECEDCKVSNRSSCPNCEGKKILHSYVCETVYTRTRIEKVVLPAEFPPILIANAYGNIILQINHSAIRGNHIDADLEKKCVQEISKKVSPQVIQKVILPFYHAPNVVKNDDYNNKEKARLVRTVIEILQIPVIQLQCKLKDSTWKRSDKKFKVIIYDHDSKQYFDEVPRTWTRKASSWIAGIMVIGIPIGMLIGKIMQLFL